MRRRPGGDPRLRTSGAGRGPAVLAWALFALVLVVFATYPWFDRLARDAGRPDLALLAPFAIPPTLAALTATTVGAVLASRRPHHPVGWLLLAVGLTMAAGGAAAGYVPYGLVVRPGALPAADLLARVYPPLVEATLALLGFVLLLTPTGSPPSPRWRRWAWVSAGTMAVLLVAATMAPGRWTRPPWPSMGRSARAPSAGPCWSPIWPPRPSPSSSSWPGPGRW
jgi:hypothetical protein